jgi:hypothetical protein
MGFLGGLLGGGGSGSSGGYKPLYTPTGLSSADQLFQSLWGQEQGGLTGPGSPGQAVLSNLNPDYGAVSQIYEQYAPQAFGTAVNNIAPYYWGMASQADAMHNLMSGIGNQDQQMMNALQGGGQQVFNTAMDPQNALYNKYLQQTMDQSRANVSSSGLATSPYAAGLENQAASNFNLDWRNRMLQNQLAGLQGLSGADTTAGRMGEGAGQQYTAAQAMSSLAPQLLQQSSMAPLNSAFGLFGLQNQADTNYLNTVGASYNPNATLMAQMLQYMGLGGAMQGQSFNQNMAGLSGLTQLGGLLSNQYGMGSGQGNQGYGILGNLFSGISNIFGGGGGAAPGWVSGFDLIP